MLSTTAAETLRSAKYTQTWFPKATYRFVPKSPTYQLQWNLDLMNCQGTGEIGARVRYIENLDLTNLRKQKKQNVEEWFSFVV